MTVADVYAEWKQYEPGPVSCTEKEANRSEAKMIGALQMDASGSKGEPVTKTKGRQASMGVRIS